MVNTIRLVLILVKIIFIHWLLYVCRRPIVSLVISLINAGRLSPVGAVGSMRGEVVGVCCACVAVSGRRQEVEVYTLCWVQNRGTMRELPQQRQVRYILLCVCLLSAVCCMCVYMYPYNPSLITRTDVLSFYHLLLSAKTKTSTTGTYYVQASL